MKKRILSFALAASMVVSMLPWSSLSAAAEESNPNLAFGKPVLNHDEINDDAWRARNLVDGITTSVDGNNGYSTNNSRPCDDTNNPDAFTIDLGAGTTFNKVVLFPRTNAIMHGTENGAANFPYAFEIQASDDVNFGEGTYDVLLKKEGVTTTIDNPLTFTFESATKRYLRFCTTQVGKPDDAGTSGRVQLAEFEVYNEVAKLPAYEDVKGLNASFSQVYCQDENDGYLYGAVIEKATGEGNNYANSGDAGQLEADGRPAAKNRLFDKSIEAMLDASTKTGEIAEFDSFGINDWDNFRGKLNAKHKDTLVHYTGKMTVKEAGDYSFFGKVDNGMMIKIDGTKVFEFWGNRSWADNKDVTGETITLTAGEHDIDAWYIKLGGGQMFGVRAKKGDADKGLLEWFDFKMKVEGYGIFQNCGDWGKLRDVIPAGGGEQSATFENNRHYDESIAAVRDLVVPVGDAKKVDTFLIGDNGYTFRQTAESVGVRGNDGVVVDYEGYITPNMTGDYTFGMDQMDNGLVMEIAGQRVFEFWCSATWYDNRSKGVIYDDHFAPIHLEEGVAYPFKATFLEIDGGEAIQVGVKKDGGDNVRIQDSGLKFTTEPYDYYGAAGVHAKYTFDDNTAADITGHGFNGTPGTAVTFSDGRAHFPGGIPAEDWDNGHKTESKIALPANLFAGIEGDLTMEFIVNKQHTGKNYKNNLIGGGVNRGDGTAEDNKGGLSFMPTFNWDTDYRYATKLHGNEINWGVGEGGENNGRRFRPLEGVDEVITVVQKTVNDQTMAYVYSNGELVSYGGAFRLQDIDFSGVLSLGSATTWPDEGFKGDIDSFTVYEYAMSDSELKNRAAKYVNTDVNLDDVVAKYDFNEVTGNVVPDVSGNGNDAEANGKAGLTFENGKAVFRNNDHRKLDAGLVKIPKEVMQKVTNKDKVAFNVWMSKNEWDRPWMSADSNFADEKNSDWLHLAVNYTARWATGTAANDEERSFNAPSWRSGHEVEIAKGHLAMYTYVQDGKNCYIYCNGFLAGRYDSIELAMAGIDADYYLGSSVQWNDPGFNGEIDEFAIYDHALNAAEVKKVYEDKIAADGDKLYLNATDGKYFEFTGKELVNNLPDLTWDNGKKHEVVGDSVVLPDDTAGNLPGGYIGQKLGGKTLKPGVYKVALLMSDTKLTDGDSLDMSTAIGGGTGRINYYKEVDMRDVQNKTAFVFVVDVKTGVRGTEIGFWHNAPLSGKLDKIAVLEGDADVAAVYPGYSVAQEREVGRVDASWKRSTEYAKGDENGLIQAYPAKNFIHSTWDGGVARTADANGNLVMSKGLSGNIWGAYWRDSKLHERYKLKKDVYKIVYLFDVKYGSGREFLMKTFQNGDGDNDFRINENVTPAEWNKFAITNILGSNKIAMVTVLETKADYDNFEMGAWKGGDFNGAFGGIYICEADCDVSKLFPDYQVFREGGPAFYSGSTQAAAADSWTPSSAVVDKTLPASTKALPAVREDAEVLSYVNFKNDVPENVKLSDTVAVNKELGYARLPGNARIDLPATDKLTKDKQLVIEMNICPMDLNGDNRVLMEIGEEQNLNNVVMMGTYGDHKIKYNDFRTTRTLGEGTWNTVKFIARDDKGYIFIDNKLVSTAENDEQKINLEALNGKIMRFGDNTDGLWDDPGFNGLVSEVRVSVEPKRDLSNDVSISKLTVDGVEGVWNEATQKYDVTVVKASSHKIDVVTNDPNATYTSTFISTLRYATVTAEDGKTTMKYNVNVTERDPYTDTGIVKVNVDGVEATFNDVGMPALNNYSVEVPFKVEHEFDVELTPGMNATYEVSGGVENKGRRLYTITVTAEDGTTKRNVFMYVDEIHDNADVAKVTIEGVEAELVDDVYTAKVKAGDDYEIVVTPLDAAATVEVNKEAKTFTVTSGNGEVAKTYSYDFIPMSNNTNITEVKVDGNVAEWKVNSPVIEMLNFYEVTVAKKANPDDYKFEIITEDEYATAEVTFVKVGTSGSRQYTITVTAEDGTKKDRTIYVTEKSDNANIAEVKVGDVVAGLAGTLVVVDIPAGASQEITVTLEDPDSTYEITDGGILGGKQITVTAPYGNVKKYSLKIVEKSANADVTMKFAGRDVTLAEDGKYRIDLPEKDGGYTAEDLVVTPADAKTTATVTKMSDKLYAVQVEPEYKPAKTTIFVYVEFKSDITDAAEITVNGVKAEIAGDKATVTVKAADKYEIAAKAADEKATVKVDNEALTVTVISELGTEKVYVVEITAVTDNTNLKEVTVNGVKAAIAGDKVTVTVDKADKYDVKAAAEDGIVTISADLKTITVKSNWGTEKAYTLVITEKVAVKTPVNGTAKNAAGKTVLYKNGKLVTGNVVVTIGKTSYAVKNSVVVTGKKRIVKIGKYKYAVSAKGKVYKAKSKAKLLRVKVGKRTYVVNNKGRVQLAKKGFKLVGKKVKYIVNKKGYVQIKKKNIKVGKKAYKTNKKGVAKRK